ncbi:hypothetical protein CI111_04840 [Fusobacterium animalis]|uniref:Riboflavin synthase subunit alpha n=1 Tax=Fusobacterium animalis TaxID=76859 RepID=A0A2G9FMB5_9FUSO|nr:hypothetical protein CI114_07610 [Fusobacterium animalis]PIM93834.1 hypothetical protein CI111_04840 [Fusobacterium animalis]
MILEALNELVHLELLTDSEFAANVNFSSLRNLANNELFFISHYKINFKCNLLFLFNLICVICKLCKFT